MQKRKEGYYWILLDMGDKPDTWQPAEWFGDRWFVLGSEIGLVDELHPSGIVEIGELITKPKNKK